jgi:hypothetical protein
VIVGGIDPGKDGALCVLDSKRIIFSTKTPVVRVGKGSKREYDVPAMLELLKKFSFDIVLIEKQQAFPGQGVSSTFSTGFGYGLWVGLLCAAQIPYEEVRPASWSRTMLAGASGKGKGAHILAAKRVFPGINLRKSERARTDDDGLADAALIAMYGHRRLLGGL